MRLNEEDYQLYLSTHLRMIHYAGQKLQLLDSAMSLADFQRTSPRDKLPARTALYETPGLIEEMIANNPIDFSAKQLAVASDFRDRLQGEFILVKYLKKHTIFLKDGIAYGVLALNDPIQHIIGENIPTIVEAVLIPFKGKIVYDGFLQGFSIRFGGGYRSSINQQYNEAKALYGIVTELPFEAKKKEQLPEEKLDFYMKSAKNREYYEYEIDVLLQDHPKLLGRYYWHWGRINSPEKRKWLSSLGIQAVHYAMVAGTIIAQGATSRELKERVKAILPKEKLEWVFYFKL